MAYWHWLVILSVAFVALERLLPARRQPFARRDLLVDVGYLALNGHGLGLLLSWLNVDFVSWLSRAAGPSVPSGALADVHPALRFLIVLLVLDLVKWGTHYLLHHVPWLWRFHRVHHSVTTMDWIANWRFHGFEILFYQLTTAVPMFLLIQSGAGSSLLLGYFVLETAIGNLNHANVRIDFGVLSYVVNNPKMHLWHHELLADGRPNPNYGIVLSFWDWLFGTAHLPDGAPRELGFNGVERFPRGLVGQFVAPLVRQPEEP